MEELKNKLKLLNDEYYFKQTELNDLHKLIMKTQGELQNQCLHTATTQCHHYDGHRYNHYNICDYCNKEL